MAHDLIAYAGAMGAQVRHYHDDSDLEADLVLEAADGFWIPVEVKLGASQVDAAAKSLLAVKEKMERGGYRSPSALLVVVGVGGVAAKRMMESKWPHWIPWVLKTSDDQRSLTTAMV